VTARSSLTWRCEHCGRVETTPHELPEKELRAALDAGTVDVGRTSYCGSHVSIMWVVAVRPTLIGVLERFAKDEP
jgi:hypothetical protein